MDFSKKTTNRGGVQRQSMNLWTGRTKFSDPFGWNRLDVHLLLAALQTAGEKGITLSYAPGNGGVGVTVRIYAGDKGDYAYAADPEQLDELHELLIQKMGSSAEDAVMALKGITILPASSLPAD